MRSYQRLELNKKVFHCFNELDTIKELSSDDLVSFFNEVDTKDTLVSFLHKLEMETNYAWNGFIFTQA